MNQNTLRKIIKLMVEQETHSEPEQGPFPAEFHEFMEHMGHKFPGGDAHKLLRETLKTIAVKNGLNAAVDYVIEQFPQYKTKRDELKSALGTDKIDVKVKFESE